jgi:hypothetical protein
MRVSRQLTAKTSSFRVADQLDTILNAGRRSFPERALYSSNIDCATAFGIGLLIEDASRLASLSNVEWNGCGGGFVG